MTTDRLLPLVVSLCCIAALGVSATTLESSLSTSPDDVIDIQYEELPLGKGQLEGVERQVSKPGKPQSNPESGNPDRNTNQEPPDSGETSQSRGSEGGTGFGMGAGIPSLVDQLLALLRELLLYGAALLAVGLASAAGYRYRDRIRDRLAALLPESGREREPLWVRDAPETYDTDASNPIHRTWLRMLDRANISNPGSRSPRDAARVAVENGLDRRPVEAITREFEAVRYGPAEPTSDRIDRVESAFDRLADHPSADTVGERSATEPRTASDGGVSE